MDLGRKFEELSEKEKLLVCTLHGAGKKHSWIRNKFRLDPTVNIALECANEAEKRAKELGL
jgi:hypothetical protein